MFKSQLQQVVYLNTYSRYMPEYQCRETWEQTCDRVMAFFYDHLMRMGGDELCGTIPLKELHNGLFNLEALPSMRTIQMAGPALERENLCAYNCSYLPLKDWRSFSELLYILMQGTGAGFSVEDKYISQLEAIEKHHLPMESAYKITDTTEGWCNALLMALSGTQQGLDVRFDYSGLRAQGAPLITKGGRSSGPEPLKQLLNFVIAKMKSRAGSKLTALDCHDIACMCGSIVQVGGVRRSAEISLSDLSDHTLRDAKTGNFWEHSPFRAMANNSAVYEYKPSSIEFMEEWLALMKSGTGERGIFNRGSINEQIPSRRAKRDDWGVNPCGEIILRPYGLCNLSIAVARADDTLQTLQNKVVLATIWGTLQSTLTNFNYVREEWKHNAEEERLLGVDINGQMDCPVFTQLLSSTPMTAYLNVTGLKLLAIDTNKQYAKILNINPSVAVTCVKPSGNSSQLLDCSSGLHPRYSAYYVRRLRIGAHSAVGQWLRAEGVSWQPEVGQTEESMSVMVVDFPVKSPNGALTRKDINAIDMLTYWKDIKLNYTEHNPSITVYCSENEWLAVGAWVYHNWDTVGGLTFLPKDGGNYLLAPYEEITEAQYLDLEAKFPKLDFSKLNDYDTVDTTTINQEYSCLGGNCEI